MVFMTVSGTPWFTICKINEINYKILHDFSIKLQPIIHSLSKRLRLFTFYNQPTHLTEFESLSDQQPFLALAAIFCKIQTLMGDVYNNTLCKQ